jgi:hypothetical protein
MPDPNPVVPQEILDALGITQADVFHVRMDGEAWVIVTTRAKKLRYPPPPALADAPAQRPVEEEFGVMGVVATLQQRSRTRSKRRR